MGEHLKSILGSYFIVGMTKYKNSNKVYIFKKYSMNKISYFG